MAANSYLASQPRRTSHTDLNKVFPSGFPLQPKVLEEITVAEEVRVDNRRRRAQVKLVAEEEVEPLPPLGTAKGRRRQGAEQTAPPVHVGWFSRTPRTLQDPDIEVLPSGFQVPSDFQPPLPVDGVKELLPQPEAGPAKDLEQIAERDVARRMAVARAEALIREDVVAAERVVERLQDRWQLAAGKIEEAQKEAWHVEELAKEAARFVKLSNQSKAEADRAAQLAEEARSRAGTLPNEVRLELANKKEELADAKADAEEKTHQLANAEAVLQRIQADCQTRQAEAKSIIRTARAKQVELDELERLLTRLMQLRMEVESANERAAAVQRELAQLEGIASDRQERVDRLALEMQRARERTTLLAQHYAAAVSQSEMADALVQRELRESKIFQSEAANKQKDALELANQWLAVKTQLNEAKQREQQIWREAREYGDRMTPITAEVVEAPQLRPQVQPVAVGPEEVRIGVVFEPEAARHAKDTATVAAAAIAAQLPLQQQPETQAPAEKARTQILPTQVSAERIQAASHQGELEAELLPRTGAPSLAPAAPKPVEVGGAPMVSLGHVGFWFGPEGVPTPPQNIPLRLKPSSPPSRTFHEPSLHREQAALSPPAEETLPRAPPPTPTRRHPSVPGPNGLPDWQSLPSIATSTASRSGMPSREHALLTQAEQRTFKMAAGEPSGGGIPTSGMSSAGASGTVTTTGAPSSTEYFPPTLTLGQRIARQHARLEIGESAEREAMAAAVEARQRAASGSSHSSYEEASERVAAEREAACMPLVSSTASATVSQPQTQHVQRTQTQQQEQAASVLHNYRLQQETSQIQAPSHSPRQASQPSQPQGQPAVQTQTGEEAQQSRQTQLSSSTQADPGIMESSQAMSQGQAGQGIQQQPSVHHIPGTNAQPRANQASQSTHPLPQPGLSRDAQQAQSKRRQSTAAPPGSDVVNPAPSPSPAA